MSSVTTASAAETRWLGERLGRVARVGDVLLLEGPLGAGKTVLVQGVAAGLECQGEVISPTFVLVRQYPGRLPLVHADLYRLESRPEIEALGLLELSAGGVLVVEWADRAAFLAVPGAATLTISPGASEGERVVVLTGGGEHLVSALTGAPEAGPR